MVAIEGTGNDPTRNVPISPGETKDLRQSQLITIIVIAALIVIFAFVIVFFVKRRKSKMERVENFTEKEKE